MKTPWKTGRDLLKEALRKTQALSGGAPPQWQDDPKVYRPMESTAEAEAARIVDRCIEHVLTIKQMWRNGFVVVAIIAAGGYGGWYQQAQKSSVEVLIVPVDKFGEPGQVHVLGNYTPTKAEMNWTVSEFIQCAFALTDSEKVNEKRYECLRNMISGQAKQRWIDWFNENKDAITERLVRFKTIKETADPFVWNVIWEEQDIKDGRPLPWRTMNGDLTLEYRKPQNAAEVYKNRFGLWVVKLLFAPENPRPEIK